MTDTQPANVASPPATITFREALARSLRLEMHGNPDLLVMGEIVATAAGASKIMGGLADEFGTDRVIETPVSENMLLGAALGGALGGHAMVIEVMSADFLLAAASEVLNDIAKWRYQHRWKDPLNLTVRMPMGSGVRFAGPEHQQCIEGYLHRAPGLTVVAPGSAATAGALLRSAIRLGDPVVFLEHRRLYETTAILADADGDCAPIGESVVAREGRDITVVAWSWMRRVAESAAETLAEDGIEAEIVDPVTIAPMDLGPILTSVAKTGRLLVVEEAPHTGSVGGGIIASAVQSAAIRHGQFDLITMPDVPHPFSGVLEALPIPTSLDVHDRVVRMVRGTP
jgi:pyruvate/2-oxoglutarate/acetoin dehydrogenase E1 component